MGISQLSHGHGQRAGPDSSRAAHRPHRARGHGAESAARAEQRAGRVRRGRDAVLLSRLHARRQRRRRRAVGAGVEHRAGRTEPQARTHHHRDSVARAPRRRARAVHHGRESHDDRAEPQRHARAHAAVGVPRGAGHLHQRVGAPSPMSSCPPRRSPKKKGRSPTPIGACSACAKRSSRAARPGPIGRSSAIWRRASKQRLGRPNTARWNYEEPEEIFREMANVATMLKGITYDRIEKVGLQYPVPDETHPGTPFLFAETFPVGARQVLPDRTRAHGGRTRRRVSVHPHDRPPAGTLARRHDDAPLATRCAVPAGA